MAAPNDDNAMEIASSFLLQSPPGEINDVLSDLRNIIGDDAALEAGIAPALEEYNLSQFTTVDVPGAQHKVIVCEDGKLDDGRFVDPKSKTSFVFDHNELTVSDPQPTESASRDGETFREALETQTQAYLTDHFHDSVASVFAPSPNVYSIVIVANKYNPSNFWSGRWRSKYTIDFNKGLISGKVFINVHYYEQGNVQLQTTHTPSLTLQSSTQPTPQTATKILKLIEIQEGEYQTSLSSVYNEMGEKTFKGLRRALPMTRSKVEWERVLGYKLGAELGGNSGRFGQAA